MMQLYRGLVRKNWIYLIGGISIILMLTGCYRKMEPTTKPQVVRTGEHHAFIIPYPHNAPTRPHWLTGKDQVPRYPDADIGSLPRERVSFWLKVSDIVQRADLRDESQLSKDWVWIKIYGRDDLKDESGYYDVFESRKTGVGVEPYKWLPGGECFLLGDGYRKCYKKYKNEYLVFDIDDRSILPNPQYHVDFFQKSMGP